MTTLPTQIISTKTSDLVFTAGQLAVTNSQIVADYFSKQHKHVLHKIEQIIADTPTDFTSAHFSAHVQKVDIGNGATRNSKLWNMTKDGFMFLVMGFTGTKAAKLKIHFINAFNEMQSQLTRPQNPLMERSRMMLTWENGRVVAAKPLDENHFISTREELALVIKEPGFLSLEQLILLNNVVNIRINDFARVADAKLKQSRAIC